MSAEPMSLLDEPSLRKRLWRACLDDDDSKTDLWESLQFYYIQQRFAVLKASQSPKARAFIKRYAAENYWFWARSFGTVVEPRGAHLGRPTALPYIPMLHQEQCGLALEQALLDSRPDHPVAILVLKVRDMGVSYEALHRLIHKWLYLPGFTAHLGSRTEDLVDTNPGSLNDDTLFGRLEIILDHLPDWMRPAGFSLKNKALRQKNLLINPRNGNRISGEAASSHFARQQRFTIIMLDEFARWEDPETVWSGVRDSAASIWAITNPNPDGRRFEQTIVEQGLARVHSMPHNLHPYKTKAWLGREEAERTDSAAGSELGLSWEGSRERLIYPTWALVPQGDFGYRNDWPLFGSIDYGRADGTAMGWIQQNPETGRHRILMDHYTAGHGIAWYLPFFGLPIESGVHQYTEDDLLRIDLAQTWARRGVAWFGDPSGQQITQAADTSVSAILRKHDIHVKSNDAMNRHAERQSATRTLLTNCEVNKPLCTFLDRSMKNYRTPRPTTAQLRPRRLASHTWASHACTMLEYYAVNKPDLMGAPPPVRASRVAAAWEAQ
jgi:hypothetical protein